MNMPNRVVQLAFDVLTSIGTQLLMIFVHRFWDHVKMHPLRRLRLLVHEV